ncbi:MAG: dephospho-CoA kinase [Pseudomonadota bacterium]
MATPSPAASSRSEFACFRVGLTGGIGSGKSTVGDLFGELGAAIVDTDAIAHTITAPGGAAIDALRVRFGDAYITPEGALDRGRMRELVFADADAKRALEAILHPLIRARAEDAARRLAGNAPYVMFVVPLLVESGDWKTRVDRVLVVDCPVDVQVERVVRRSRIGADAVRSIIAQQASREQRLAAADDVIYNGAAVEQLAERVVRLHAMYCRLASLHRDQARSR